MLDFSQFRVCTFDCYGTLIDWETGILTALHPILRSHRIGVSDNELLEAYGEAESKAESGQFKPYRQILEQVVRDLGMKFGFKPTIDEQKSLPESVRTWQPFPDTVAALKRLHHRYKLAIISNIDDDLFAETAKLLEVPFDFVTTALEARSYKPSFNNFHHALKKMKLGKECVLATRAADDDPLDARVDELRDLIRRDRLAGDRHERLRQPARSVTESRGLSAREDDRFHYR